MTRPVVLGHRGASAAAPENTLAAFAQARRFGADGVELDVRRTADAVLVVHHDPHVEGFGLIAAEPFARLRAEHAAIPTLDEALAELHGMVVNVEIKCLPWEPDADTNDHAVVRATCELVAAQAPDAIISSFDLVTVDTCRRIAPALATAWLTSGQEVGSAARIAHEHGHTWLNPDRVAALRASPDEIARIRAAGIRVSVWTVDDPGEIRALAAAGVDAIITNMPDVALAAMAPRS